MRRLRKALRRDRKPKALATDEDPQEERSTPPVPSTGILPTDSNHTVIPKPAVINNTTAETPQGITPEGSQDHQLVIRPSIGNNVASKVTLPRRPAKRGDFKIAIICALPIEADAAHALFDRYWDYDGPPYDKAAGDPNAYSTGAVGRHNVVLAHMPGMGKARSASVAAFCKQSFPNIKLALVVGICGGVPFGPNNKEILLGDVIISNGVVQYDLIQRLPGRFIRKGAITDSLGRPDQEITSLLKKLSSRIPRNMLHNEMIAFLDVLRAQADLAAGYPGTDRDKLYQAAYGHVNDKMPCKDCCDDLRLMPRSRLGGGSPQPEVHFGLIASGDSVMKSGEDRDAIAQESPPPDTILGFEMEGAGVWDIFPCVVIKGVCDYADSHKTEDWQQYAAATAAACMKAFLRHWIPSPSVQDDTARPPFHVPYEENKSFIGRSEILDRLRQLPLGSTSHTRVALSGLGGIGKTQIAIQYTYWIKETYPDMPVFWVHASNDERFRGGYTAIAQKCKIPDHDNPKEDVMALVKGWLECDSRGEWLMVIDNADDLELFFRQKGGLGHYLPQCAHGTILVTTRNLQAASRLTKGMSMSIIKIGEMDEDETAKLLTTQLGEAETMVGEFSALSARLEHLPLALVQATSFIQENCITISDYIQLLDKSDQHLVDLLSEDFETIGRDSNTPRAVAETWILSFEQIQQRDALAGELLSIMGLLDRQAIPHEFLSTYTEDQEKGELQLTKALGVLKAFSFVVEVKDHAFDMHRLVHLVTRKWLVQKAVMQHFAKQALVVVSECFPLGEYENWTICNTYLPHVSAVLNLKEDTASREGKLARARLLHSVARLFYERGQFQTAEKYQEEAVELKQAELGEEDPNTLVSMNGLALTYWSLGRWKEAELLEVQVLDIRKRVLGKEHPDTLTSMNNLASTYKDQGRWEEAELLQVQVLDIEKRVLGEEHPHTLISMNNLASMYQHQGRWEEAELLQVQVLDIRKRVSGKEHPYTIAYMYNLARSWQEMGRLNDALGLMQDCLRLGQEVLGMEHPDTLSSMHELAFILQELGRLDEALPLLIECFQLDQKILGLNHRDTLISMYDLAFLWRDLGRLDDALELMQDCLRLRQEVLGMEHPHTLNSMHELALILQELGRLDEALPLLTECFQLDQKILGSNHRDTLISMYDLACLWRDLGRLDDALELMQNCLGLEQEVLGSDHPDTIITQRAMASVYWKQNQFSKAKAIEVEVLEKRKRILGEEHPETLTNMHNLAVTWKDMGRLDDALKLMQDCFRLRQEVLGSDHPDTISTHAAMASVYWEQGQFSEAQTIQVEVLEKSRGILGEEHPDTLTSMHNLAFTWKDMGRLEDAIVLMQECLRLRQKVLGPDELKTKNTQSRLKNWLDEKITRL